ncbi:G2/mitotic-specific cyclin-B [Scaptodrosophila lebanonensis]|uniref:G2/mitotic-specific cyclin-B n=1 Tax=Drosophila lebanonensis TaxID=7225 RepID=A0A6J2T439_DROLE|nr:G2/mitotic-specific cyclin-B [Scaptodrosophila lebanonensis]
MVGTNIKLLLDENASEKFNQVHVKKLTVPPNEATTKRAALGDLQNRGVTRAIGAKDAVQKDVKIDTLPNVLRNAKARVDSHWKKQPLGVSNINNAVATKTTSNAAGPLLRSNSMRTNVNALTSHTSTTRIAVTAKVTADAASKLAAKPKTVLNSSEQVNVVGGNNATTTLRREDSNLSRKSLTKLRAALAKPTVTAKVANSGAVPANTAAAGLKKEPLLKKEVVSSNSNSALAKLPKPRPVTTTTSARRLAGIENIDAGDSDNLVLVSQYVNDIYDYLYQVEEQQPIHKDHLAGQLDVTSKMRAVLIDWINEVHMQFRLAAETFQLAVAIIDLYLQKVKDTKRSYLQLVGVTALFIATKFEELFPPALADFVYITDDTYNARQIRQMELHIFKAIDCNLSRPLPIHFLRRFSKAAGAEDAHHALAKYFLELALMDYELASYKPSEIAAASLFLSLHLINGNSKAATGFNDKHWTTTLAHYSRYTATHLRPITKQIAKLARDAPTTKLRAIYNKYQGNKFQKIAMRPELYGALMDSIVGKKK